MYRYLVKKEDTVGLDFEEYKISKFQETAEMILDILKAFWSDIPLQSNVRNRLNQITKAEFIPRRGSKCTNQKVKPNWHCVFLNTNQLAGYSRSNIGN